MNRYVFQVATPFSVGTGVYLPQYKLVVTNEHVVRDNASVVIGSQDVGEQLATVVYLDSYHDLALLAPERAFELDALDLVDTLPPTGTSVVAMGQCFGEPLRKMMGEVLESGFSYHGTDYLVHDARMEGTLSGGPLFTSDGRLLGINMLDTPDARVATLSLPAGQLRTILADFARGGGKGASRCFDCRQVTFEQVPNPGGHCPGCGAELVLPSAVEDPPATGVNATIEAIITGGGHDPRLARRGPNLWNIREGSANITVAYHEDSGLVTGDAYLCKLPDPAPAELFAYLLRENARLRQLTFSTYGRDIILSLLIYDRYLTVDSALPRFENLFSQADAYDNVLVDRFGAGW